MAGKAGEEGGGRLDGLEGAVGGEQDGGVEREESGAGVGKEFLAGSVKMVAGGGEQEEGALLAGDQLSHHAAKCATTDLDGEDGRQQAG